MSIIRKWIAIQGSGDQVRLLPMEGHGPDFFVKATDYDALVAEAMTVIQAHENLKCSDPGLRKLELAEAIDALRVRVNL